jgi:isoleucyl-tRNA synthetase
MYEILTALLKVTAPLLVFTSDEAWGYLACKHKKASVHLEYWPDASACSKWTDKGLEDEWAVLSRVREDVLKKIEQMRSAGIIGASLEASVTVVTDDAAALKVLAKHRDFLRYLFIVSGADVIEGSPDIIVKKAAGAKCARCWNYSEAVGKDERHPALCERCVSHLVGGMLGRY